MYERASLTAIGPAVPARPTYSDPQDQLTLRALMEQAQICLDAALAAVPDDLETALDDMAAARLLVATALCAGERGADFA